MNAFDLLSCESGVGALPGYATAGSPGFSVTFALNNGDGGQHLFLCE